MTNPIEDIGKADTILVTGSNTTEAHPVLALEVIKAVKRGAKLIVIEPRRIKLVDYAAAWLSQTPGTDVAVLNAMMHVILEEGLSDSAFIAERTEGFKDLEKLLKRYSPEEAEKVSGVPAKAIREAARMYATAGAATIVYAMGITQHTTGVDNVLSLANLAMMTGNIGREGTGVNPLRGQNNVQGACDVGALPNVLPGYQNVEDRNVRAVFESAWGARIPDAPGLAATEMIDAAAGGAVKAMYIMGENPVLSEADACHAKKALKNLDFLVVQDIFLTETAALADVVLPGVSFAEKFGTFTNTERRVQPVRRAIKPIGDAKPDWKIVTLVATAMGYPLDYSRASDVFEELASVTPQYRGISHHKIDVCGVHWPCPTPDHPGTPILHVDKFARGKGKFHAVEYQPPAETVDAKYPLVLTTGRYLEQFHTGTMTRRVEGLEHLRPRAEVDIHPEDAKRYKVHSGGKVKVTTRRGAVIARASVTKAARPGTIFMPFHYAEAPANKLTNPARDPVAKIPEYKFAAARIQPA